MDEHEALKIADLTNFARMSLRPVETFDAFITLAAEVRRLQQLIASTPREWFAYDKNTGHGHVYPRTDGLRARCGGPGMCDECSRDQVRKAVEAARERGGT